jgi:hypothetical protein
VVTPSVGQLFHQFFFFLKKKSKFLIFFLKKINLKVRVN